MPIKIFFCYAREDILLLEQLKNHLKPLEREQLITMWYDRNINAGKEWEKEIDSHLNSSQIILLFVSPDFLASDYCYGVEMKRALERHEQGEARVIPFIARPVDWENEPFHKLQMLPRDGQALTTWVDRDEAFAYSVKDIRKTIQDLNTASQHEILQTQLPKTALPRFFKNADTIRKTSEPQVTTPSLLIFLGSTAALSAVEVMQNMLTLKQSDQRRVALVYVDTDAPSNSLLMFRYQHKNLFQEFPMRIAVPRGVSDVKPIYQGLDSEDQTEGIFTEQHTFIQNRQPQYFTNGAGGIRNNGHVAACFNYHYIRDTLDRAITVITHLGLDQGTTKVQEVQINIVAFLGGGTGSGILPDVAVIARHLLNEQQYRQRINLFCILPESMPGVSLGDLRWRKSNATACLLELIAYSGAAVGNKSGRYAKYMRDSDSIDYLTGEALTNEVYLVGHTSMDNITDVARIVGLDLFQRITDASGVGFLERSKWVDRRTLGQADSRGVPAMFGTSCPFEVRFPADETATAYARVSASYLLPLLASYQPTHINVDDNEKLQWERKWQEVASFDTHTNDPQVIKLPTFNRSDFDNINQMQLDLLWKRLEWFEHLIDAQIRDIIGLRQIDEEKHINELPRQPLSDNVISLLGIRLQYLNRLQEEYRYVLDKLLENEKPKVPARPVELEIYLTRSNNFFTRFHNITRDFKSEVYNAYLRRLRQQAAATRHRLLEKLLKVLIENVEEARNEALSWFQNAKIDEHQKKLEEVGMTSMAWQGLLEHPHPHQRHIFDLHTLGALDDHNPATKQLYRWATGGDKAIKDDKPIDYSTFVTPCIDYLGQDPSGKNDFAIIENHNEGRLVARVVNFFYIYYKEKFQDMNLFELLDKATPVSRKGQLRAKQISDYLIEHFQYMRSLISSSLSFGIDLSREELSTLETSLYLSMHWRDGHQLGILDQTLKILGSLTNNDQIPMIEPSIDPHRLQLVYGQHAISLSTIRDFSLDQNSAMEAYLTHQQKWMSATTPSGLMPVHSSEETQRLVWDKNALGYGTPLPERIIR